jgi:hypothetical protein
LNASEETPEPLESRILPNGEYFVGPVPKTLHEAAKAVAEFDRMKEKARA